MSGGPRDVIVYRRRSFTSSTINSPLRISKMLEDLWLCEVELGNYITNSRSVEWISDENEVQEFYEWSDVADLQLLFLSEEFLTKRSHTNEKANPIIVVEQEFASQ